MMLFTLSPVETMSGSFPTSLKKARVTARLCARSVTIKGCVMGSVTARDTVDIRDTGSLDGDVVASRFVRTDGRASQLEGGCNPARPTPTRCATTSR